MKAFLSHSSHDKELVRAVASHLKRQYCVFDERSFENGKTFQDSILQRLDETNIFVLFASKNSLESLWVDFETKEAWYRVLEKQITRSLVYILDEDISISDLPSWLQRAKVAQAPSAKTIAREIRSNMDDLIRAKQSPFFIGRARDQETFQRLLAPTNGSNPPHVIALYGLPGIGRRTLIRETINPALNLPRSIFISIEDGDELGEFAIKLANLVELHSTPKRLFEIAEEIKKSDEETIQQRIISDLRIAISNGEAPILFDAGGLLNEDGHISEAISSITRLISEDDDIYLFLVSTRRPSRDSGLPTLSLNPLAEDDCKTLISALAHKEGLKISASQISEVAEYVNGFPPACHYAIHLARDYGIDLLIADKRQLVAFRRTPFIKHLTEKRLSEKESSILLVLAEYSPLPLAVIGQALNIEAEELGGQMMRLIDYALVISGNSGLYSIAEPIRDVADKISRFALKNEHGLIANSIKEYLSTNEDDESNLALMRVLYRAASNAGDRELAKESFHMPADVIDLAQHHYHLRDYPQAAKFAREALDLRPRNITARSFLIRSLIQDAQWEEADKELNLLSRIAPLRDFYFLKGFLERKRDNIQEALKQYQLAEGAGRSGSSLYREMAHCYFVIGDINSAAKYLKSVLERNSDDRFVIDFAVQVATRLRDEPLARERLQLLARLDSVGFYLHRVSTVELAFGNPREALTAAKEAVQNERKPSFEMLSHLAVCSIKCSDFEGATEAIGRLESNFRGKKVDVRLRLKAYLEIERENFSAALSILKDHPNKNAHSYLRLKKEALEGALKSGSLSAEEKNILATELTEVGLTPDDRDLFEEVATL